MDANPLSKRGIRRFLAHFWQHQPHLARAAIPRIDALIDRNTLFKLACRDDVESRLVIGAGRTWKVRHGPFVPRDLERLPQRNWTLLVNGVENFVSAARALQTRFGFIPYARHDDVMISYAVPGGSVGPHYDSYDVFLIQGQGRRRWRISAQNDLALVQRAPLKLLRQFRPDREWTLNPGDMLYLPPQYAHHGVACDECITWSIGVRTPTAGEIAARFLDYLQDTVKVDGDFRDRVQRPQRDPAAISASLLAWTRRVTDQIRWRHSDVVRCVGAYLSEPRPNVVFLPRRDLTASEFGRRASGRGIRLAIASRMLVCGDMIFINGESATARSGARRLWRDFANHRALPPRGAYTQDARALLYQWYKAGYIELPPAPSRRRARAT